MRVLFYHSESAWSGAARISLASARGLAARGHQVTIASCSGSSMETAAIAANLDTTPINASASAVGGAFDLRRVLAERFIEVAIVVSERDQLVVGSAMRFAQRGAVLRRTPAFAKLDMQRGGKLALRLASAGVIVSADAELQSVNTRGWAMLPMVAPIGVDPAVNDAVEPATRAEIGALTHGKVIACAYDPSGRYRLGAVLRTLALLAPRHRAVHLAVFGPGANDDELRLHTAALGVSALVSFIDEARDPVSVMRAATAGWVVGSGDAAALACLDFMSMRVPVIADRSPMAQHYVADGITGMLLSTEEPSHTASAVAAFLTSDDARLAMGNAGRARVLREFTETAMVDGFERAVNAAGDRTKWAVR
ncbi:MAG: glycosyltransferase [Gemmatimonadaceae bacterium]